MKRLALALLLAAAFPLAALEIPPPPTQWVTDGAGLLDPTAEDLLNAKLRDFEQSSGALSRLLVVVEQYPDLKSNRNFLELQSQLEGTENRIAVERQRYNTAAQGYNTAIRRFPASFVASLSGFKPKAYFKGAAGSSQAPNVQFNF